MALPRRSAASVREAAMRPDHRIDDDRARPGNPQRPWKEAEGIAIAKLHRPESEETALLEATARRPAPGSAPFQAKDTTRRVAREIRVVRQLDQRHRDP